MAGHVPEGGDVARGQLEEREGVLAGELLLPRLDSFLARR